MYNKKLTDVLCAECKAKLANIRVTGRVEFCKDCYAPLCEHERKITEERKNELNNKKNT